MTADRSSSVAPKRRFPEFRGAGDWMTKILDNQGSFLSSLTGKSAKDFGTGDAAFIPYMNVFSNTFTNIFDLRSVNIGSDESQNAVAKGDVFFTISSETPEEAGMSSVLLEEIGTCYLNSFCALFRFHDGRSPNPVFLGYLLRSALARAHLSRGAQGATRYNVSKATFRSLPLQFPSGPEQQKVADCLGSMDDLIAAGGRKLETLRQHKQGLVQHLFPQEGETQPRLRFLEFRNAPGWVQTPLGDAFKTITNGHANAQDHQDDGAYPLFDRSEVVKRSPTFRFDAEAVILPGEGMRFQPRYFNGKFDLHQRAYALMEPTLDPRFAFHALDRFKGALADSAVQSTVRSLRMPIIEKFAIPCPTNDDEQQKIADCIGPLDDLIGAEGRKLDSLRQHKRGLMQQVFPSLEGH